MAAKKKTRKKKRSKAAKKIAVKGAIPRVTLDMALDERKIAAIQRCLKKGRLRISLSKVDLVQGRLGDPWLYD